MQNVDIWKKSLAFAGLLFVVLVASHFAVSGIGTLSKSAPRSGLYAVFLTNGQVYFGNITSESSSRLVLKNIYYIQKSADNTDAASDVTLLKLGNELHGPEDMMEINQDHILFVETLRPDGRVGRAIKDYKTK